MSDDVTLAGARRSSTVGLVVFLFGLTGAPELPGVVLTRLLGDFGVGASAARQQLARMRAEGQVAGARTGRSVSYRLTDPCAAAGFERLRVAPAPPVWEGRFHALLFQVPETLRAYRDRLRRQALVAGYGTLQPGVLIAARDRSAELRAVLDEVPDGSIVRRARLDMDPADARAAASAAWGLPALACDLREHLHAVRNALDDRSEPPVDATTLRRMAVLVNETTAELLRDPGLPAQLYPPDWPGEPLRATLEAVTRRYHGPAAAYVRSVMQERRTGG